jgi:hypothetical protein
VIKTGNPGHESEIWKMTQHYKEKEFGEFKELQQFRMFWRTGR